MSRALTLKWVSLDGTRHDVKMYSMDDGNRSSATN